MRPVRPLTANLAALNRLPRGKAKLFRPTVIRFEENAPASTASERQQFCLMNTKEHGWSSYAVPYPTLAELFRDWAIEATGSGRDEHGPYIEVSPIGGRR